MTIIISVWLFSAILLGHILFNYFTIEGRGTTYHVFTFSDEYMIVTVLLFIYPLHGVLLNAKKNTQYREFYL